MSSQDDDGGSAKAEGKLVCQLGARDAAHPIGTEESSHGGKATRARGSGAPRSVLVWEYRPMSDTERLVRVYATGNAFDGLLTKGHLEAEGITVLMKGESEGPYRAGPVYLWVTSGDEGRAREVIRAIESGAYATSDDDVLGVGEPEALAGDIPNEQPQR